MTKAPKPRVDWEAVERDYRGDVMTNRELARQYGCSEGAIRKKAKAEGWEKDLSEQVSAKVRNELVRTEVRTETPGTQKAPSVSNKEIVEHAAAIQVQVVREHRTAIKAGKELVDLLMGQLRDVIGIRDLLEAFITEQTAADDDNGKRYNALMKAVALPTHVTSVTNLANALKTYIGLERQAFNLGDEPPQQQDPLAALIQRIQSKGSRLPIRNPNQKTSGEN